MKKCVVKGCALLSRPYNIVKGFLPEIGDVEVELCNEHMQMVNQELSGLSFDTSEIRTGYGKRV